MMTSLSTSCDFCDVETDVYGRGLHRDWCPSHRKIPHQPKPKQNNNTPIVDLVVHDLNERAEISKKEYGTYLQAGNGRDALIDAYEEALDLAMYLRQLIEERDNGSKS
jgi:hypothetical protein